MSYIRKYSETITENISKNLEVRYINKQNVKPYIDVKIDNSNFIFQIEDINERPQTKKANIQAVIPVLVEINVDTNPFDQSVSHVNSNIDILTGAVIASEAAQIASIHENSKKVGNTIVSGFFSYIRSEISQQIAELTQNIDSQLMHLRELSIAVVNKKKQMFNDFERISSRYIKIFDELNSELSNRIYELDKPTFLFKKETDKQAIRSVSNDLVNTATVFGFENSDLHSKISTSIAKKRTYDTIIKARKFLSEQNVLNKTIHRSMLNENVDGFKFAPICFVETQNNVNQFEKELFSNDYINYLGDNQSKEYLLNQFSSKSISWKTMDSELNENIKMFFNSELAKSYDSIDSHSTRVKEMILKLSSSNSINVINL